MGADGEHANIIGGMERAPLVRQVTERKTQKGLHCRIGADDLTLSTGTEVSAKVGI